jgi:hypothetical protein
LTRACQANATLRKHRDVFTLKNSLEKSAP